MKKRKQQGQALILLAFALVALAAMAGLAIDGGRLYVLRRQAQNAADAAAKAGTLKLAEYIVECRVGDNNAVDEAILDILHNNGFDFDPFNPPDNVSVAAWYVDRNDNTISLSFPSDGPGRVAGLAVAIINEPPDGATGVRVRLVVTETTTMLRIIGQENIVASAEATAITGPVRVTQFSGGGMLPIGFPVQEVDRIVSSGNYQFTMFDGSGAICRRDGVNCPSNPPAQASRGWLNFNYMYHWTWFGNPTATNPDGINLNGSTSSPLNRVLATNMSNADLKEWAENGAPHPVYFGTRGDASRPDNINDPLRYPLDGDFIVGQPGARESTRKIICDTHMNQVVYLPIFDYVQQQSYMNSKFVSPSNPRQFPSGQFLYYHIVGFLTARIDSCAGGNQKTINGTFISALIGEGTVGPGMGYNSDAAAQGSCALGTYSVSLWR